MIEFNTNDVRVYLAPPGAGKTHALMDEMVELLKTYRPDEVAFVTFTKKGVMNGIERALKADKTLRKDDLIHFKTLHAMSFRESGLKHKNIIERRDMNRFNDLLGFNVHLSDSFENTTEDDKLLQRYDAVRAGCKNGVFIERVCDEERYERLVKAYEVFKTENDLVDFYDCLIRFKERGLPVTVKVALIDEAQDLTPLQWEVCRIAFSQCEKIRIAGDDYQALFSYAGASPETLIALANKYKLVKLEKSFRLPNAIYKFAKGITNMIKEKVDKDFVPVKDDEGFVKYDVDKYALCRDIKRDLDMGGYQENRWYILYRNNCFIQDITPQLELNVIPYHTAKGFVLAARDIAKVKRYLNYRKLGGGSEKAKKSFMQEHGIVDINKDFTESDLIPGEKRFLVRAYVEAYGIERLEEMSRSAPFLFVSTPHKVKGGEAEFVAVSLDCTALVSQNATLCLDEELRVLYVSCTRAKKGLYLMPSAGRYGLDRVVEIVKEMTE